MIERKKVAFWFHAMTFSLKSHGHPMKASSMVAERHVLWWVYLRQLCIRRTDDS